MKDFITVKKSNTEQFKKFYQTLIENSVYFPPSQFEAAFISLAHNDSDIEQTLNAIEISLRGVF